jgi:hypothetical protein
LGLVPGSTLRESGAQAFLGPGAEVEVQAHGGRTKRRGSWGATERGKKMGRRHGRKEPEGKNRLAKSGRKAGMVFRGEVARGGGGRGSNRNATGCGNTANGRRPSVVRG